jgi:hypothetical protein
MTNEPEWRDANPATADLPNKGRTVILCLAGGLALGVLSFVGMRIKPVGLAIGGFALFSGIGTLLRMRMRRQKANFKIALIITAAGFLLLATHPRFGIAASFAGYFLITGAIGLVVFGLIKAVKLAWDLTNRS